MAADPRDVLDKIWLATRHGGKLPSREALRTARFTAGQLEALGKRDAIAVAIVAQRELAFDYTRKYDGKTAHYVTRPYEVKGKYLYATEGRKHGHEQIHSFISSEAVNVRARRKSFAEEAVWPPITPRR